MKYLLFLCLLCLLCFAPVLSSDPLLEDSTEGWENDDGVAALENINEIGSNLDGKSPLIFNAVEPSLPSETKPVVIETPPVVTKPFIPLENPPPPPTINPNPPSTNTNPPTGSNPPKNPPTNPPTVCGGEGQPACGSGFVCNNTDIIIYINITRIIRKKVYIPYYVYYSPHEFIVGQTAVYISSLIKKTVYLRRKLRHFRVVLKHLVEKKSITHSLYKKTDDTVIKKMVRIEQLIKQRKLTIEIIKKELDQLEKIFIKLDYNPKSIIPDCDSITKLTCNAPRVDAKVTKKGWTFVDKIFEKVFTQKTGERILHLTKHKGKVVYIRRGKESIVKTKKINPKLRKLILEQAYTKILQNKSVLKRLKRILKRFRTSKSLKVKNALKDKAKRAFLMRKIIKSHFKKRLAKQCSEILKTRHVVQLRKTQFKDVVRVVRRAPKVVKEMFILPRGVIKRLSIRALKKLALYKFRVSPQKIAAKKPKKVAKKKPTKETPKVKKA